MVFSGFAGLLTDGHADGHTDGHKDGYMEGRVGRILKRKKYYRPCQVCVWTVKKSGFQIFKTQGFRSIANHRY